MKKIGKYTFPESREEAQMWIPVQRHTALARQVLIVAQTRVEGAWKAYADAVPGFCHEYEVGPVLANGSELPEKIAQVLFPCFEGIPYAK